MRSSQLRLHIGFRSRFLPDDRDITIYLPPGYEQDVDRCYPVLYMQDGQNLFGMESSSWRLAQSADAAIGAGEVEPLIIVGLANAGERRVAEYTPTIDWKAGGGEADKYGQLLIEELMPFVAANYRASTGAKNSGLGGSSLGGLATLYLGLKYDDTFGKLAVLSPSIWWNHRAILEIVTETALKGRGKPRIWLDIGDAEGRRALADADLLSRRLRTKGWRVGVDLNYDRIAGGTHDERAWAQRVRPMLRFLFPA